MKTTARMSGNAFIIDSGSSLSNGSGFVDNPTGSGALGQSIDVYIGGSKVGYWDSAGWH